MKLLAEKLFKAVREGKKQPGVLLPACSPVTHQYPPLAKGQSRDRMNNEAGCKGAPINIVADTSVWASFSSDSG